MIGLREHKADASFRHALGDAFRFESDFYAQCLQYIGCAALARCGPVAVFGHFKTRSRRHETRRGRNIEAAGAVAAGADDIDDRAR